MQQDTLNQENSSSVENENQTSQNQDGSSESDRLANSSPGEQKPGSEGAVEPTLAGLQTQLTEAREAAKASDIALGKVREQRAAEVLTKAAEARETQERTHQAQDAEAVESGDMTAQEALDASNKRREESDRSVTEDASVEATLDKVMPAIDLGARYHAASELADKYNLQDLRPLMDTSIPNSAAMEQKAQEIAESNREGTEQFDGGVTGRVAPPNTNGLHGLELANLAYSEGETNRRNRANRG